MNGHCNVHNRNLEFPCEGICSKIPVEDRLPGLYYDIVKELQQEKSVSPSETPMEKERRIRLWGEPGDNITPRMSFQFSGDFGENSLPKDEFPLKNGGPTSLSNGNYTI